MEPILLTKLVIIDLVTLTIATPATAITGGNVPTIDPTHRNRSSTPKYAFRRKLYSLYTNDNLNSTNCDSATVTVNVAAPSIDALNDTIVASQWNNWKSYR
jgi:hypothetical protein